MRRHKAFTLVEVFIVSGLMAFLAVLLSESWRRLGPITSEILARGQLIQETEIAVTALTRDLGGNLSNPGSRLGDVHYGQFVGWTQVSDAQLWLCFDSTTTPNGEADWTSDTVIKYYLDTDNPEQDGDGNPLYALIREDSVASSVQSRFTVARNVQNMTVTSTTGDAVIRIALTFQSKRKFKFATGLSSEFVTRTCTLDVKPPPISTP